MVAVRGGGRGVRQRICISFSNMLMMHGMMTYDRAALFFNYVYDVWRRRWAVFLGFSDGISSAFFWCKFWEGRCGSKILHGVA